MRVPTADKQDAQHLLPGTATGSAHTKHPVSVRKGEARPAANPVELPRLEAGSTRAPTPGPIRRLAVNRANTHAQFGPFCVTHVFPSWLRTRGCVPEAILRTAEIGRYWPGDRPAAHV